MTKRFFLSGFWFIVLSCMCAGLSAQNKVRVYAAAFYNLENLWDTEDDPNNRGDDDFTPDGQYNWTEAKYQQKLKNIAKVISELGRDYCPAGPAIIGISEVENRKVLEDLVKMDAIAEIGYKIVHFESPDHRGIDVAALYNPRVFRFTSATVYPFRKPDLTLIPFLSKPKFRMNAQTNTICIPTVTKKSYSLHKVIISACGPLQIRNIRSGKPNLFAFSIIYVSAFNMKLRG